MFGKMQEFFEDRREPVLTESGPYVNVSGMLGRSNAIWGLSNVSPLL